MAKKFRIGIIGAGKIVESIHLPVLLNLNEVLVCWIFDKSVDRSRMLSKMYGIKLILEQNLEDSLNDIDICLIAIPYGAREKYIYMCSRLKKCVYVEKPFALSLKEHENYCNLFSPSEIAIGFQRRYYPFVSELRQIINENTFGTIKHIQFNQGYFQLKGGTGFLSNAKLSGGGVIIESAIHSLDQILQFTTADNVVVKELVSLSANGIDYDTKFTSKLTSGENSFTVYSHISSLRNLANGITIEFEEAIIQLLPNVESHLYIRKKTDNSVRPYIPSTHKKIVNNVTDSFIIFWLDFIKALSTKQYNQTNACTSLVVTTWIEQLYKKINN